MITIITKETSTFLTWKNPLNVRSKNLQIHVSQSNFTKIKYGYKNIRSNAQINGYSQLIHQNNNIFKI